jgi:REP element-mobilizing transposase RayT
MKRWPRRPPRLARLFDNVRPFYFITFNTYKRQGLLARDEIHDTFCIFATTAREHDFAIGRYVIMPDHVHLFAAFPPHSITLPTWVQSLRNVIGKKLLRLGITNRTGRKAFAIIYCEARKLRREMGICPYEPGASKIVRHNGGLAISR